MSKAVILWLGQTTATHTKEKMGEFIILEWLFLFCLMMFGPGWGNMIWQMDWPWMDSQQNAWFGGRPCLYNVTLNGQSLKGLVDTGSSMLLIKHCHVQETLTDYFNTIDINVFMVNKDSILLVRFQSMLIDSCINWAFRWLKNNWLVWFWDGTCLCWETCWIFLKCATFAVSCTVLTQAKIG